MSKKREKWLAPAISCDPKSVPDELKEIPSWVVWALIEDKESKKGTTKHPYNARTHRLASVTNPKTWSTFKEATRAFKEGRYAGLGFVLTNEIGIVGIDLDNCRDADGQLTDEALEIIQHFNSYTELSPSGTGVRIFIFAEKPEGRCRKGDIEVYGHGRFLTVTGQTLEVE